MWTKRDWLIIGAQLLVVILVALPVLTYPLGRDQGEFATIGRGILQGRIPYVDLWNPKPPAVFYVYAGAMALFGQSAGALRLLDLLFIPPTMLALYWLGRQLGGRAVAFWAALLFGIFYFTESFWTLTQNDGLVLLPMTCTMACAWNAARTDRRAGLWAFAAGALCGVVLWFKYPFVLFVGAVVAMYALNTRRETLPLAPGPPLRALRVLPRVRGTLRPQGARGREHTHALVAFTVGGLLTGGGFALYLASLGALDDLIESARVTSAYTALGFNLPDMLAALQTYVPYRWAQWGLLFVLAALWLPLRRFTPPLHTMERGLGGEVSRAWLGVWLWLAAGLLIMLVQAKGYDYHWLPMLPPLCLIAGWTLARVIARISISPRPEGEGSGVRAMRVIIAGVFVALGALTTFGVSWRYLTGQEDVMAYHARFVAGEFVAAESTGVVNFLRERVVPGDSLFIWGFRPEVYYLSGLNPASRFIFQFPLVGTWYPPEWKQDAVDVLWAAMPPYALVLQVDYMPWVTGRSEDSNTLLQEYTELNNWLIANYERETQIGNFFVWRRTS